MSDDCDLCRIHLESDCPECEARSRRRRIEERFERLLASAMSASDCIKLDFDKLWDWARLAENFLEGKRK